MGALEALAFVVAAKRARAIVDNGEDEELTGNNVKPVTMALEQLVSGEALLSSTDRSYT